MNSNGPATFHRHATDYLSIEEWGELLHVDARVARALGSEPIPDARHLLPDLTTLRFPADENDLAILPGADFVVELRPERPRTVAETYSYFPPAVRARLDFPRIFVTLPGRDSGSSRQLLLDDAPDTGRVQSLIFVWSLPDLVSIGDPREAAADLRRFLVELAQIGIAHGFVATAQNDPTEVAHRAAALRSLLRKIGGTVEMRLLPLSGSFASRDVWRAIYSMGLRWGTLDLFHWYGGTDHSLFRVLASGTPAYFLPERAAEGERVTGLILEYDLPRSPDPLMIFDRMAVALAYLRTTLGGRPITRSGAELDGDHLDAERDALESAIQAMTHAGIAPGTAAALRFF